MKKLLFILIFLPAFCLCQNKLDGIGPFRINVTTVAQFEQFVTNIKQEIKVSDNLVDMYRGTTGETSTILLLIQNKQSPVRSNPFASKLPDEKVYFINHYEVAGIPLEKIYLRFWKDTLYSFECISSPDLSEAMELKYGKAKTNIKEKEINCRSALGVEFKEKEITSISTWANIQEIEAQNIISKYFDSKCKANYLNSFSIYNIPKVVLVRLAGIEFEKTEKQLKTEETKSKLKDF
jgi:hypothetical protein